MLAATDGIWRCESVSGQANQGNELAKGIAVSSLLTIRNHPRILKLPPYLSLFCIFVGLFWLLLLPLDDYSRKTYISENALLPGQVHTYFGGSEHNIFRAYRQEVGALNEASGSRVAEQLGSIFQSQGLKVGRQKYTFSSHGEQFRGENVYAVLQGPRADATEAIVLVGAWRTIDGTLNTSGVALVLTLARYFKRWSLWSKDIIFVVTEDSTAGPQAWVDAYHSTHDPQFVDDLPIKSGALQGAIAIEYTAGVGGKRFDKLHVLYDGVNGQLPNLDLFNTVVLISTDFVGVGCTIQRMWQHSDSYRDRLLTMLRGVLVQSLGHASGPHSSFIPYHVDAVTLQTVGDGWQDEIKLGRVIESSFRSLNNLLEHLHQSFFFYLLMSEKRFVSIATYLPSAMLVAGNFSIMSIALWLRSGTPRKATQEESKQPSVEAGTDSKGEDEMEVVEHEGMVALVPQRLLSIQERKLAVPLMFLGVVHFLGLIPLYLLHHGTESVMALSLHTTALASLIIPATVAYFACQELGSAKTDSEEGAVTIQTVTIANCFTLLLLGVALSTLSTLNFALGLLVGLLASPLTFAHSICIQSETASVRKRQARIAAYTIVLYMLSPTSVMYVAASQWSRKDGVVAAVKELLTSASFAWVVDGTWTSVVVWLVWWPAWLVGASTAGIALLSGSNMVTDTVRPTKKAIKAAGNGTMVDKKKR